MSNLTNKAMVLLNYRLGDVAERGGSCTCRRNLPTIRDLLGRIDDFIVIPNDELVSPFSITHVFSLIPPYLYDVKQYQVIQNDLNDFLVKIVPDTKADLSALSREITSRLKKILGTEAEITVHYVEDIPKPSGKARTVISKIPTPGF